MLNGQKQYVTLTDSLGCRTGSGGNVYPLNYIKKFSCQDGVLTNLASPIFLRWGELILDRAEAYAHLGDVTKALADVNVIRKRAGLSDADARACICASFRYVLRWLRLAGLEPENVPFASYSEKIETILGPEIAAQYLQILPLWQEAAYSTHEMTEQQRTQMRVFLQTAVSLVWKKLSKKQRLWTTYWLAL